MTEVLIKLIDRKPITDEDLANELYEVCSSVHASCSDECPIFSKFGGSVPRRTARGKEYGCDYFKSGRAMLDCLRAT